MENGVLYIGKYLIEAKDSIKGSYKIKSGTKCIAGSAFAWCEKLTGITIPDSVTSIGAYAFDDTGYYNNSSNWKNNVLYIGKYLIEAKNSIKGSYKIKSGTKYIANEAFWACKSLTSVTIPDSVTSIGDRAFEHCTGLTSIKIPNSVKNIGYGAFGNCAFLESVTIGNSVTSIGVLAFSDCTALTSVRIPKSVTSIGEKAFGYYYDYDKHCYRKYSGFKIYGYEDSAAETYAKENGFKFVVHSHSYTSKVTKKATTSKSGTQKFTCSCGKSYTKTIAKISSVKLSKTSYTYNGEAKKPTVTVKDSNGNKLKKGTDYTVSYSSGRKSIGTYTVTVTFKGKYSGSKKLTFKIVPGKVTGVKQQNKKGINFKWNAVKGAEGYQIYKYNSSKKKYVQLTKTSNPSCGNSSAKGSMKIKIRAYKIVGERVYYGAFSDPVTLKAKK